jgi:uncharacterized protein (TIGR03067 family)
MHLPPLHLLFAIAILLATSAVPGTALADDDNKDLLGHWEGFVMIGSGPNPGLRRANVAITIEPSRITCRDAGNIGEGTYRITPGQENVRNIDAIGTAGFYKGHVYQGILTREGDTLKWCSGDPGKGRPAEFRTVTSKGHYLMILTRK